MGKPVSSRMLSAVRKLWGHRSTGPTAVFDQSMERMNAPISPPPDRTVLRSDLVVMISLRPETALATEAIRG